MGPERRGRIRLATVTVAVLLLGLAGDGLAQGQSGGSSTITRVSVSTSGAQGTGESDRPSISPDGHLVVFESSSPELVAGDTNGTLDIFLHDQQTGETRRISLSSGGSQANGPSQEAALSADGTIVAFSSVANNLVPGDTNGSDIFVRDLTSGVTTRVSVADNGDQAQGDCETPAVSADGRFVAFTSNAENLVPGDDNGHYDVFVRDRLVPGTTRVSVATGGVQANGDSAQVSISGDGRYVAFQSRATDLVPGGTNGWPNIYFHDRVTGETVLVSAPVGGGDANEGSYTPSLSSDGRYVAFASIASNLVAGDTNGATDVFGWDHQAGTLERVSVGAAGQEANDGSSLPKFSPDGRFLAFMSRASNLVSGDTNMVEDIYVRDLVGGTNSRVSRAWNGAEPNFACTSPAISGGASAVAFSTLATNLVPGDTNFAIDVFLARGPIFVDGFESGDSGAWSAAVP